MKQVIVAIAATLMLSSAALAQDNEKQRPERRQIDRKEMMQKRTEFMVKKYALNDEQAKQLQELNAAYADKMVPRMERRGPRPNGPKAEENKDIVKKNDKKAKKSEPKQERPQLTEEQKAKFESQRKEREANAKAYEEGLAKILTEEQLKAYKADQEKVRRQGPRGGNRQGGGQHRGPRRQQAE